MWYELASKPKMLREYWKSRPLLICLFALTLTVIFSHAQDGQSGFISIDCGLDPGSTPNGYYEDDDTGIRYTGDEPYIDAGVNQFISRSLINESVPRSLWTVRSFPNGTRNCYNLTSVEGKGVKYLIRAMFMHGNYDGQMVTSEKTIAFDLHLGVELWDTVELSDSTSVIPKEIIHVSSSDYLYVCLVNSGRGTPFISALELRQLINQDAYPTPKPGDSLDYFARLNFAPADPKKLIRYPADRDDRLWHPFHTPDYWVEVNTTLSISVATRYYNPPSAAMQTAVTPRNASEPLKFYWTPANTTMSFYIYMHFAEVRELQSSEYRAFYINLNGGRWYNELLVPRYLSTDTIETTDGFIRQTFNYSLERSENSTLPPIINALEVYTLKSFSRSQTNQTEVGAILNIKSTYGVNRSDWQGDPCLPREFMWDALDCFVSRNTSVPPRIKSLNLSASGLTGKVSFYLSSLSFLENLDLSNNHLNGSIPDFLAELPQLKFLNLSGNQFSGSVPAKLLDKAKNGLELRADGFHPCDGDHCETETETERKKSNKFVVPLVVSLAVTASLVILAALIVTLMKIRRTRNNHANSQGQGRKDGFLEKKNIQFTYFDLVKMTSNFKRVLGKGSSGTVYHGVAADGKQVAVKLLYQSSSQAQGYSEFQTEAELLTRVHHRNLTSLVGYCYEGDRMALVYEYMACGNLRQHLSGPGDGNVLSWSRRLHILLDAAQGLDYLHNGCKPPIIHRDVKSTNILLNEKFEAKLADFGLSKAVTIDDGSFVSTRVVGTPGYLDPEYYETQRLHEKSDIYSLGIVIVELITGRPVKFGTEDRRHILHWISPLLETGDIARIVDPKLGEEYDANSVWKTLEIGMACASPTSSRRPAMAHVLTALQECLVAEKVRSEGEDTDASNRLEVNSSVLETEIGAR